MEVKVKKSKIVLIVVILVIASALTHMADVWTIPVQNEATVAQLNGGDMEMVATHSTNSILERTRSGIIPLAVVICMMIAVFESKRMMTEAEKSD